MSEFDPRQVTVKRKAPSVLVALAGLILMLAAWRMTAAPDDPALPTLDAAALARLQHLAFAEAEAQPGYARPQSITVRVQSGETLEAAVRRTGVAADEAHSAVALLARTMDTVNIRAGMAFDAAIARPRAGGGPARLIGLSMRTGPATALTLSRSFDGALRVHALEEQVTHQTTVAAGEIQGSLYESAARAGADTRLVGLVVNLFSHQVDFDRDIQAGDRFNLVFDREVTDSGRTVATGALLYAELEAKGGTTRFYSFYHDGKTEFFDETGKNIRGMLLRTPVDGARITSTFGMRLHPVLGYTRMHQGIDFGAGAGTPILAAGDGVIVEARRWGGYGNWVRIRHAGGWETGYGHMMRFAPGIGPGVRVSQGQVIGYVGSTGTATGPHLHYEVWLRGQRINPIGANIPQGVVLAGSELVAFQAQKARIDAMIAAAIARNQAVAAMPPAPKAAPAGPDPVRASGLRPALNAPEAVRVASR